MTLTGAQRRALKKLRDQIRGRHGEAVAREVYEGLLEHGAALEATLERMQRLERPYPGALALYEALVEEVLAGKVPAAAIDEEMDRRWRQKFGRTLAELGCTVEHHIGPLERRAAGDLADCGTCGSTVVAPT